MRQQDKLVHDNEDGSGIAKHMLQMMEHFVKFVKKHCRQNCNHHKDWMTRLFQYLDCVTIGSVGYDLVDFKSCKTEYDNHRQLIFDENQTPQLEQEILLQMPKYWYEKWQLVHQLQFGQIIGANMKKQWNQHLYQNKYDEINSNNDDVDVNYMNMDGIDSIDGNSSQSSGFDTGMRNLSVGELSQRMLNQTSSQSQSQMLTGNVGSQSNESMQG